tara:strand:+ start:1261 stop:2508 length:1248 start_codon:yes stop_codon:yes gene_type:complete
MAFSFISFIAIVNPKIYGYQNSYFVLTKTLFSIFGFLYVFLNHTKRTKNRNILFRYLSYFAFSILLINIFNPAYLNKPISILKIISFYSTTSLIVLAFPMINDTKKIASWMMSMGFVGILHSIIIFIFFKQSGTMLVGPGRGLFHGAFLHPNSVGITVVPFLIVFIYMSIIYKRKKYKKFYYPSMITLSLILIYLSKARGSAVALLIAILITIIVAIYSGGMRKEIKFIVKENFYILFVFIAAIMVSISISGNMFSQFVSKGTDLDPSDLKSVFLASRGSFILMSVQNFLSNPFFGIGFGVPTIIDFTKVSYDPIFNIPISAPVEKAFFFSALIEEFGIVGSLIFIIFYYKMTMIIFKNVNSIFFLAIYFSIFTLSIFEYYFFSMGTLGSFNWLWIGLVYHLAWKTNNLNLKKGY